MHCLDLTIRTSLYLHFTHLSIPPSIHQSISFFDSFQDKLKTWALHTLTLKLAYHYHIVELAFYICL